MKKMVLLSRLFDAGMDVLEGKVSVEECFCDNPYDVMAVLQKADGVLIGNQRFGADIINACPNLGLIAKQGSGVDNIDLAAATKKGIPVVISPGANAQAVAEHVMMLILCASRNLIRYDKATRNGDFAIRSSCAERGLHGKRIGLVGYGKIGQAVCAYANAFGMQPIVFDPYLSGQDGQLFSRCDTLDDLLTACDVVSIHVPLTNETRGMVGEKELAAMKSGSILINCSRGGIVDEAALYQALKSGHLHGAGLDVHSNEPCSSDNPLFSLDNIVVTPHSAALTKESADTMSMLTAEGILAVFEGRKWTQVANPEVL
ncbi:MAG: hydroxyacid dehydrogenase [Sphaerochaetaceae bacterium]|nr:hydroxyacid dehydrogenase [Sphaerochaetaceae bacterium]